MKIVHKYYCDVYKTPFHICFDWDAYCSVVGDSDYCENRYGQCSEGDGNIAIYIKKEDGVIDQASLVHELFHAVDFVFDIKGVKFNGDADNEHFAYYLQFLFEKVNELFELERVFLERFNDND